jgi:hypothetical protein
MALVVGRSCGFGSSSERQGVAARAGRRRNFMGNFKF